MVVAMRRRPSAEAIVSFIVVAAGALFVFVALHPSKLFSSSTPAGGDMGAHVWAPNYLRHHLFPHGRISGWTPDWYAGFPALTFYFPLPYLVIALFSFILPYGVAFKLVSVAGLVGLPISAWAFGRLMRMRFPGPPLLALATVPFLFDRYWTIYGGNIASTLAGEFAFAISLCLALLFLGVFNRCLETGRHRGLAAVLFAATLLCHLLPTLFALAGAVILFALRPGLRRLTNGIIVGAVGLAIAAFWLLPFVFRLGYSNDMGWERTTAYLNNLLPFLKHGTDTPAIYTRHLKVVAALAAAGAIGGIALRRRATLLITGLGLAAAAAFRFMPQAALWNARMLPFWYLSLYLAAAAAVAEAATAVGVLFGRRLPAAPEILPPADASEQLELELVAVGGWGAGSGAVGWVSPPLPPSPPDVSPVALSDDLTPHRLPAVLAPLLVALIVWLYVGQPLNVAPKWSWLPFTSGGDQNFVTSWANWNYSGYQGKASYPEYQDVVATMAGVGRNFGCGRAMWEYESEEDRFGTPMALMLLPMWTNGCIGSMEGLFFESSATVPYHFLNQSELSVAPSDAMRGLNYKGLNVADGIAHLRLMGVRYYMAISPQTQAAAAAVPGVHLIAKTSRPYDITYTTGGTSKAESRQWEIFEIDGSDIVAPLSYQPVVMTGVSTKSKGWITLSQAWYQDPTRWDVPLAASGPPEWTRVKGADANPPRTAVRPAVISNFEQTDDRISFDVDQPGSPVLVKTSYFPNWQATGARGPWRVTPNLMVVIPTSTHVSLHYGFTPVDNAGRLLTIAGLIGAAALWRAEAGAPRPMDPSPSSSGLTGSGDDPASDDPEQIDAELAELLADPAPGR